jgi:hypothetical protein
VDFRLTLSQSDVDTFERLLRGVAVIDQVAFEAALVKM